MSSKVQAQSAKLAVLIDADNASPEVIEYVLKEVEKYGIAAIKRIYGDWSKPQLSGWKLKIIEFALHPIQQCSYANGKNSTDIALIIDAMDLLHTQNLDGFCIVSSDSDYSSLAIRIRESGLRVFGFGEAKTLESFRVACDIFVLTEALKLGNKVSQEEIKQSASQATQSKQDQQTQIQKIDKQLKTLFKNAYVAMVKQDEWIDISPFGIQVRKLLPSFDPGSYGRKKLSLLVQDTEIFEVKKQGKTTHIRLKSS